MEKETKKKVKAPGFYSCIMICFFCWLILTSINDGSFSDFKGSSSTVVAYESKEAKVYNSSWDASVRQVKDYLKANLNDASSYEAIEWGVVVSLDNGNFLVRHKYRAKNAFGAYVLAHQRFVLSAEGDVIDIKDI